MKAITDTPPNTALHPTAAGDRERSRVSAKRWPVAPERAISGRGFSSDPVSLRCAHSRITKNKEAR